MVCYKTAIVHGLKHDSTIGPCLLVTTILHEFHDHKGHQGTICMFEVIRMSYWWPKPWQNIIKYKDKCSVHAKHLPNMAKYPQQHLEMPLIPMTVLAIESIGHLPITSKGNRWALKAICLHTSDVFAILMKEKLVENIVQAYLSSILAHKCGSVAILSANETEFKNKVLNEACNQLVIKRLFSNPFPPQATWKCKS